MATLLADRPQPMPRHPTLSNRDRREETMDSNRDADPYGIAHHSSTVPFPLALRPSADPIHPPHRPSTAMGKEEPRHIAGAPSRTGQQRKNTVEAGRTGQLMRSRGAGSSSRLTVAWTPSPSSVPVSCSGRPVVQAVPLPGAFVEGLQALPNNLFAQFQVRIRPLHWPAISSAIHRWGRDIGPRGCRTG